MENFVSFRSSAMSKTVRKKRSNRDKNAGHNTNFQRKYLNLNQCSSGISYMNLAGAGAEASLKVNNEYIGFGESNEYGVKNIGECKEIGMDVESYTKDVAPSNWRKSNDGLEMLFRAEDTYINEDPNSEPPAKRPHIATTHEPQQQRTPPQPTDSPSNSTLTREALASTLTREALASMTLWPEDPFEDYPFELFDNFVLPRDNYRFEDLSIQQLIYVNAMHQGRSMAALGQTLHRLSTITAKEKELEADIAHLQIDVQTLTSDLEKEQSQHANTIFHSQELMRELKMIKRQSSEIAEQRQQLLEDRVELKAENEKLKGAVATLQNQVGEMHSKMMNLIKTGAKLEKEYVELKKQGPPMTEAAKQQLIAEYRRSPELTEAVISQFGDGYDCAKTRMKERMLAASLDPQLLDSSDEESEAEKDLPSTQ